MEQLCKEFKNISLTMNGGDYEIHRETLNQSGTNGCI